MRGDVYLADLNPRQGSEQAGIRPVIIIQHNNLNHFTRTVVVIPLTTNLRRQQIPGTVFIPQGEGGLTQDSVALCFQIRAIDQLRLKKKLGTLSGDYLEQLADALEYTLDMIDY